MLSINASNPASRPNFCQESHVRRHAITVRVAKNGTTTGIGGHFSIVAQGTSAPNQLELFVAHSGWNELQLQEMFCDSDEVEGNHAGPNVAVETLLTAPVTSFQPKISLES